MEGFVHNLNTMHSRAGAQTPFSSINYGTDTSPEGRMVIRNILLATDAGLGHGETCIFPIHVFKVKEGVNYNEGDPNYDLFKLSCKVSAKRLFPNYIFLDAPFNLQYYKPGHPETEVATMGCRTRVMGNVYDPTREISYGRGNLSFTSINLPRIAIEADHDEKRFYEKLDQMLELVAKQLLDRFEIQASKRVYNYPFLMGQGVWMDSDKLNLNDEVREVLKHGTLFDWLYRSGRDTDRSVRSSPRRKRRDAAEGLADHPLYARLLRPQEPREKDEFLPAGNTGRGIVRTLYPHG